MSSIHLRRYFKPHLPRLRAIDLEQAVTGNVKPSILVAKRFMKYVREIQHENNTFIDRATYNNVICSCYGHTDVINAHKPQN